MTFFFFRPCGDSCAIGFLLLILIALLANGVDIEALYAKFDNTTLLCMATVCFLMFSFCQEVLPDLLGGQQPFEHTALKIKGETKKAKARQYRLQNAYSKLRVAYAVSHDTRVFKTAMGMSRAAFCLQQRAFRRWKWHHFSTVGEAGARLS